MVNLTDDTLPTQEMFDYFELRTTKHIELVQKNLRIFIDLYPLALKKIMRLSKDHDLSKFSEKEFVPYVWLTWIKKPGNEDFQYDKEKIDAMTKDAWKSHIKSNSHHPEHHKDINSMTFFDIIEMICDWEAMSEELGGTTREWYNKNVPSRWKFDKVNQIVIENLIHQLEQAKGK